jgi:N-acetylmuramoyl-L-alanine amidase
VNITSRAEWGAKPAKSQTRLQPDRVSMIVLHHTTGSYASHATVRSIQAFHQGPERKWADIGYSFLVAPTGEIFEGRGWDYTGAHARGHNSTSIGIAYIGDGRQSVPDAAKVSILRLSVEADRRFGVLRRVGHRDVGSTVCPGDVLYAWWVSGPSLPSATPLESPVSAVRVPPSVCVPEEGEVSSERISERPSGIPDLRDGWRRHMDRMGWSRRR